MENPWVFHINPIFFLWEKPLVFHHAMDPNRLPPGLGDLSAFELHVLPVRLRGQWDAGVSNNGHQEGSAGSEGSDSLKDPNDANRSWDDLGRNVEEIEERIGGFKSGETHWISGWFLFQSDVDDQDAKRGAPGSSRVPQPECVFVTSWRRNRVPPKSRLAHGWNHWDVCNQFTVWDHLDFKNLTRFSASPYFPIPWQSQQHTRLLKIHVRIKWSLGVNKDPFHAYEDGIEYYHDRTGATYNIHIFDNYESLFAHICFPPLN